MLSHNPLAIDSRSFVNLQWIGLVCLAHLVAGAMLWSQDGQLVKALPTAEISISLLPPSTTNSLSTSPKPVPHPPKPTLKEAAPSAVLPTSHSLSTQSISTDTALSQASAPHSVTAGSAPSAAPVTSAPRFDAAYLNNPAPSYPTLSRRMGEEGRSVLSVNVGADGLPKSISIAQSSGSQRLDSAAMNAVWKWKFIAAQQNGQAIAANVHVPIFFKLD